MKAENLRELYDKSLLQPDQYQRLEPIVTGKVVSLFYELRTLLYLGIMLFTTGAGILIYQNIGDMGHLLAIAALSLLTIACFAFAFLKGAPYSNERITPPLPYYDYVVLLGCLLLISVLGYIQFQYGALTESLGLTTLVTSILFFYVAYRMDHLGVLSLAITAFASYWSIRISPQKWYHGDFFSSAHLNVKAIIFGSAVFGLAILLDNRRIKKHFTFTYVNFASLIFLTGALASMFMHENAYFPYLLLLLAGCTGCFFFARWKRSFLFLLYAFIFGYIGITFFLAETILSEPEIWFLYMIASCGGFIGFIIKYRTHFKRES